MPRYSRTLLAKIPLLICSLQELLMLLNLERETSIKIESVTSQNNVDLLKIILDRRRTTKRNESDPDSKVFQVNFWFNLLRSLGQVLALTQLFSVCFFFAKDL